MVFIWQIYVLIVALDITGFAYYCFTLSRMAEENGFERSNANYLTFKSILETAFWVLIPIVNIIFLIFMVFNGDYIITAMDVIIKAVKEDEEILKDLEQNEEKDEVVSEMADKVMEDLDEHIKDDENV